MCGRYVFEDPTIAGDEYRIEITEMPWEPSYNIGPFQDVMAIRELNGKREAVSMQWSLVPHWHTDGNVKWTFNARSEDLVNKPTWRDPFKRSRCIIPNSAFIEWQARGTKKQPYLIFLKDRPVQSFAGLWDRWRNPETGEVLESCSVITVPANDLVAEIHDKKRMPVYLHPEEYDEWLDPDNNNTDELQNLLTAYPEEAMDCFEIDPAIGNIKNDYPELIKPQRQQQGTLF